MPTKPLQTRYEDDQKLFPDMWHKVGLAIAIPLALAYPFLVNSQWLTVGNQAWVYIVGAIGMMILTGFCGQFSVGHAAFIYLGGYTTAILGEQLGMPFWMAIPFGGLVAAAVGLSVGPFALRLEGYYLAIVTLGLLFLVNHTLMSAEPLTRGAMGIAVPMHTWFPDEPGGLGNFSETLNLGPIELTVERKLYFFFLLIALVSAYGAKNLMRTNTGRAMMAVRDHDIAAEVMGINPARAKITSFGLSSFVAGIAGGMYACQQQYLTIDQGMSFMMSIQYIAIIVLGGIGTVFGAVWGAIVYVVLNPLAEELFEVAKPLLPMLSGLSSHQQATLLFSVVVVVLLIFEPLGLLGFWLRTKRYFMAWPFKY